MKNKLLSSDFNKNVLTLLTGTTVAQAIPIAISPILTRLYTPEDFGVLALFIAITAIFGSIANARYELAIVLPEKEEDSINLVALSILIAIVISSILLMIILIFHSEIIKFLDNDGISLWLYFIPLVVLLIGVFNALNYWNTRVKTYKNIAQVNIFKSITLAVIQLSLGLFKAGASGLLTGQIASHIVANGKLAANVFKDKALMSHINKDDIVRLAQRYSKFPKFSMWSILANSLSQHLTSVFISFSYSVSTLGYYSLVQRILGMPSSLIGNAIGQVFFQEATEERNKYGHAKKSFNSTLKKLLVIAVPIFTVLFFIVEDAVIFIFGDNWKVAGEYAKVIMPLLILRFIMSPLSMVNNIFEKQKIALSWQLILLILSLLVFTFSYLFNLSIIYFLSLLTVTLCVHYAVLFIIVFKVSRGNQ